MDDSSFKADVFVKTSSGWSSQNPYVGRNDLAIESDTGRIKVGSGLRWNETQYVGPAVLTDAISFVDGDAQTHSVAIVGGLITTWTVS